MDIILSNHKLSHSCSAIMKLSEAPSETCFRVIEVPDIALLDSLGIQKGGYIMKHFQYALGGPVVLGIDKCQIAIGRKIASLIKVTEADCDRKEA